MARAERISLVAFRLLPHAALTVLVASQPAAFATRARYTSLHTLLIQTLCIDKVPPDCLEGPVPGPALDGSISQEFNDLITLLNAMCRYSMASAGLLYINLTNLLKARRTFGRPLPSAAPKVKAN